MKLALAVLGMAVMMSGCRAGPHAHTGTVRVEVSANRTDWYLHAPRDQRVFKDGDDEGTQTSSNMCGYVFKNNIDEGLENSWIAAVYGYGGKGPLLYHTREAANDYVESWCKP